MAFGRSKYKEIQLQEVQKTAHGLNIIQTVLLICSQSFSEFSGIREIQLTVVVTKKKKRKINGECFDNKFLY